MSINILSLEKKVNLNTRKAKITIEIEVPQVYSNYDMFPDELIPELLVAVGRDIIVSKGKIKRKSMLRRHK